MNNHEKCLYIQGVNAYLNRISMSGNPYDGWDDACFWEDGWEDARAAEARGFPDIDNKSIWTASNLQELTS